MSVVRNPRVALGVTALAGLTALGAVGVAMSNDGAAVNGAGASRMNITAVATTSTKSQSSTIGSSLPIEPSPTEPTDPTTNPPLSGAGTDQLYGMLPAGFDKNNCQPTTDPVPGSSADLTCGSNTFGPSRGEFVLFSDQGAMDQTFQGWSGEQEQKAPCPGFQDSPADWFYDKSQPASGKISCGTYKAKADLVWTENDTLMLGNVSGTSIDAITKYWRNPGSAPAGKNRS